MDLSVIVIGDPHSIRNKALLEVLPQDTRFVPPVFSDQSEVLRDIFIQFLLHGRRLTAGEIGCASAHMNARQLASLIGADWSIILEDDAAFSADHFSALVKALASLDPMSREIIVFPVGPGTARFDGLEQVSWLPTGAVASCYSRASLTLMRGDQWRNEVADWPIMFCNSNFWLIQGANVGGVEGSTIGVRSVSRATYATAMILRTAFSPLIARGLGTSVRSFLAWYVVRVLRSSVHERLLKRRG